MRKEFLAFCKNKKSYKDELKQIPASLILIFSYPLLIFCTLTKPAKQRYYFYYISESRN